MQVPDEAVQLVAERMFRRYESEYQADHLTWRDFADDARADLEAAAPILAETWGVDGTAMPRPPGGTSDPRAGITCRRCGAQSGQMCVTSSGTRAPMVHAERRNDARRAEGRTVGLEHEGTNLDRFPSRGWSAATPSVPAGTTETENDSAQAAPVKEDEDRG